MIMNKNEYVPTDGHDSHEEEFIGGDAIEVRGDRSPAESGDTELPPSSDGAVGEPREEVEESRRNFLRAAIAGAFAAPLTAVAEQLGVGRTDSGVGTHTYAEPRDFHKYPEGELSPKLTQEAPLGVSSLQEQYTNSFEDIKRSHPLIKDIVVDPESKVSYTMLKRNNVMYRALVVELSVTVVGKQGRKITYRDSSFRPKSLPEGLIGEFGHKYIPSIASPVDAVWQGERHPTTAKLIGESMSRILNEIAREWVDVKKEGK